ncbi:MAG: hypothetical protein RBS45_02795 [Anaerolineales bacterium]|jgi:hypothetical protein|nr:hypothetical protein [Anaerolineales bacterium]GER79467.1 conserved hypothetical protein [Candidatus Denitrolinea symbiosum]
MPAHRDSFQLGRRAEDLFAAAARSRGWTVTPAPKEADIHEHWDFEIRKDGYARKVEVKAMKRESRSDERLNPEWVWIEFRNVRGEAGWLFGKANWIAFETADSFLIIDRHDLYQFVRRAVDRAARVESAREAKYKTYTRKGRPDQIAQIRLEDLRKIKKEEWAK